MEPAWVRRLHPTSEYHGKHEKTWENLDRIEGGHNEYYRNTRGLVWRQTKSSVHAISANWELLLIKSPIKNNI